MKKLILIIILSDIITTSLARRKHRPQPQDQQQPWELSEGEFTCPDYSYYAYQKHLPFSAGKSQLPYQRPVPACRKFNLTEVEDTISDMKQIVKDPDLFRLFENCFPNTLDTAIAWNGVAAKGHEEEYYGEDEYEEELTFITTGDIPALWLRDSSNQLLSYLPLLRLSSSKNSLASLYRGLINLQARYILTSPHCNAFHPPSESNLSASLNPSTYPDTGTGTGTTDYVYPSPDPSTVFECKYELDSLASFLHLSHAYHNATGDTLFFSRARNWVKAVDLILNVTTELQAGTYKEDGSVAFSPYQFQRSTSTASETLGNAGAGNPVRNGTGMVRSAFRPSDDACIYQLFVPGNMMFSTGLERVAEGIVGRIEGDVRKSARAKRMGEMAQGIRKGVERVGRAEHWRYGRVYAYEVDGFGSHNLMDDANIPSLLSAPLFGYVDRNDPIYLNTRRFVLSRENPYYMVGPVLNGTGGPHVGPGMAWPMSLIVQIMTSDDDAEIVNCLRQILSSTDGLGLIHESISAKSASIWTRQWFSWANGLFGQMMLDLRDRKPHLLSLSYQ